MNEFKDNIINKIKAGDISMRPKWHFVLKAFLLLSGVFLAFLIAVYLLSFVFFTLRQSGLLFAPQFGWHGVIMFIISSPWLLIGILGIFLLILYVLVSKYSFSYQKPLVYSIVGVVLFVIAIASFIQYVGVHDRIQSFSEQRNVPGLTPLYKQQAERKLEGVAVGSITSMSGDSFIMETLKGESMSVTLFKRTKISPDVTLEIGEQVMVFGDKKEDKLSAFGIRKVKAFDRQSKQFERPGFGERSVPPPR